MKTLYRFLVYLMFFLLVLVGFVFSVNNTAEIPLWIGVELAAQPVSIWVILAFVLGGLSGLILGFGLFRRIKLKVQISQLSAKLNQAEKESAKLRAQLRSQHKNQPRP